MATTRLGNEAELRRQVDAIAAIEPRPLSGEEGQMAPGPCAMLAVYTMQSLPAKWVASKP